MQAVLVMFRSDGERRSFSVTRDVTVIGRREDCDLRVPLGDISRKHARLIKEGDQLRIEDLGSSNGTHLNGQRIERDALLQAGDSVQIGPVVFVVQVDGYPPDDELNPMTAESAAAAAMFAAPGGEGQPGEDQTMELGGYEQGGYAQPAEYAGEGQYADEPQYAEGELDPLEPLGEDALAEQPPGEPALDDDLLGDDPLADMPLAEMPPGEDPLGGDPLGGDPLGDEALGDDALTDALRGDEGGPADQHDADQHDDDLAPPPVKPPPMRASSGPPPIESAPIEAAVGDDELTPLHDDPIPLAEDDGSFDLIDDSGSSEEQTDDELQVDFDEPEKK